MPTRRIGTDARGKTVAVDDCLIDKRGRVYIVCWTERALRRQKTARVLRKESYTYVRLTHVFRVRRASAKPSRNRARWARLYENYVKPMRRKEVHRLRRVAATSKMWRCPVCINGRQPTRFKIGVQVWKGKRLRVCSTPCRRRVLKGVRHLQEKYPEADAEFVRRQVAYQYMKAGGQL